MCIAIVNCLFPDCDVINCEINLISLIKLFFCMTKKSRLKYLQNEKSSFQGEIIAFFMIKGLSVAKHCPRLESTF